MKLRNKKTSEVITLRFPYKEFDEDDDKQYSLNLFDYYGNEYNYNSLTELNEEWEDYKPAEPLIKDEKIRKLIREWAKYNETKSVYAYNLVFDHNGVCIKNALVGFYDPLLRTNIIIWFQTEAPTFKKEHKYTIEELCGKEE